MDQLDFLKSSDSTTQTQIHDVLVKMARDAVSLTVHCSPLVILE